MIVGSGGAGLVAALKAKELGESVVVISKSYPTHSQTCMAQGGINAAIGLDDSVDLHVKDTLKASYGLADDASVRFMCESAPEAIEWLDSIGVPFSRSDDARIAQRMLGGASRKRACYAQDYSGLKILQTLYDNCLRAGVEFVNEHMLISLIVDKSKICRGVNVLDIRSGLLKQFCSKSVILATGGYSRIYGKYSTNATATTGDGIAAALRVGARLDGLEFVQFHPTALKRSAVLISESARGEGGVLINSLGERFVDELATRDEVSRAIFDEISSSRDVFLDISSLGEEFIDTHLPQERHLSTLYEGVDPVFEPIPIRPAAHYSMGGIQVDSNTQSGITALFAVGECANHSVHGANRLGGNSLLEIVVFGSLAAKSASQHNSSLSQDRADYNSALETDKQMIDDLFDKKGSFFAYQERLSEIMYHRVGIKRNKRDLELAIDEIGEILSNLKEIGVTDKSREYNSELVQFLEFKNMAELSLLVARSALQTKESCGAHFRVES